MSVESAWGNCGETAWKKKKKTEKEKKGTKKHKTKQTESTEQRAHKRERQLPHRVQYVKADKNISNLNRAQECTIKYTETHAHACAHTHIHNQMSAIVSF